MSPYAPRRFALEHAEDLISFCQKNGVAPFHGPALMKRFLTDLVSSPEMVLDLMIDGDRVAVAALIDRPQNAANSANLEIIGLRRDCDAQGVVQAILTWAKEALPANRASVDVGYHASLPVSPSFLEQNGFRETYSIYEMRCGEPVIQGGELPKGTELSGITEGEIEDYYKVVLKAFEQSEDANIPPLDEMRPQLLQAKIPPEVIRLDGRIVGFYSVKLDESDAGIGVVNTLGVLPEVRRHGYGQVLLAQALRRLKSNGVREFHLSVSASNERALGLYKRAGFRVVDCYVNYRFLRGVR